MEPTHNSQQAGPSSVSLAATENVPAGDTGENTIAKTNTMCSTCNQVNVNKLSIKCLHCKKSYHVTCAKPKMNIPQARTLAPNWRCGPCMERIQLGDSVQNSQPAPSQSTPEDFAVQLAGLKNTTKLYKRIPKGVRRLVANALSRRIESAVESLTKTAWWQLTSFA